MSGRRWWAVPATLVVALGLASCAGGGSGDQRTATAVFDDVGDLSTGAQVQLANVPIGSVTSIALDGDKAKVTMEIQKGVQIPDNVTAALESTTILGDQFVAIEVPKNEVSAHDTDVPQLPDGGVIRHTTVVAGLEQLVQSGAEVFGAVSTTELENVIAAGGEGFTNEAASLRALLSDLSTVTGGYSQHTSDITGAINGLNQLSATLAPDSGANADALTTLSKTVTILAQNSAQFETLLQSIDNLSIQGRGIIESNYPEIVTQLQTLEAVSAQLSQNQADLVGILDELPANNSALPSSVRDGFIQVFENLIICGVPGGGEDDSSPAFTCAPTTNGSKK